ncbi:cellulase family glycosylhydrolase [Halomicrobium salinisoli]|uniref:cellulase family glycosylhydrolase n=1 Tax=Halomicrobium salinisoli TaxID=2878391 RepID=UPI001CF0B6E7|nr:cellulase family glycosylhydrolase [Halomicrobium salinisoli]
MRRDYSRSTGEAGANDGLSRRRFLSAAGAAGALTAGAGLAGGTAAGDGVGIQEFERLRVSSDNRIVDESGDTFVMRGLSIPDPKRLEITKEVRGKGPTQLVDTVTDPSEGWYPRVVRVPAQPTDIGEYPMGHTGPRYGEDHPAVQDGDVAADRARQRPPQPTEYEEGAFTRDQLLTYLEEYYDDVVERCRERGVYCIVDFHRHWHEQPPGDGEGNGGPEGSAGAENHLSYDSEYTNYWAYNDYYGQDEPASWGYVDDSFRNEYRERHGDVVPESALEDGDTPYDRWRVNQDLVDEAVLFWDVVAERYADEPHVVFEPYNEPTAPGIWGPVEGCAAWKQRPLWDVFVDDFATPIMDTIRDHAPDTLLLMSVPGWCQSTQALHWRDFEHETVAVTWHNYAGHSVSTEANWLNDADYGGDACNGWEPEESQGLQNVVDVRPVVVTEFGWQNPEYTRRNSNYRGLNVTQAPLGTRCRCGLSSHSTASYGAPFLDAIESDDRISWVAWCADVRWQPSMFRADFPIKSAFFDLINGSWYDTLEESPDLLPKHCPDPPCEWELWDHPNMGEYVKQRLADHRGDEVPFPVADDAASVDPIDGATPTDPDGDGLYEDLNGNGEVDYADVVSYFTNMEEPAMTDNAEYYDYNDNGEVDYADLVDLFQQV